MDTRKKTIVFIISLLAFSLFGFATSQRVDSTVYAVNVQDYGTVGDCVTDDTVAIQNAILAFGAGDNILELPSGCYKISDTLVFDTVGGIKIKGDGRSQNGTVIKFFDTTKDIIHVLGRQFVTIEGIAFTYGVKPTSGYAIVIEDSFETTINDVRVWNGYNGISVIDSTETYGENINFRNMIGTNGIFYGSNGGTGSYGATFNHVVADNPYPNVYRTYSSWYTSTSYTVGDVIVSSGRVYQASQSGTSGTTIPSGVPGTNAVDAFSTEIIDGTVKWKFVSGDMTWLTMGSYAHSLRGDSLALLNGRSCFLMSDTVNNNSYPTLVDITKLECDHNLSQGINLSKGANVNLVGGFAGSCLTGNGVIIGSSFVGGARITGMDIRGNAQYGLIVNGGRGNVVTASNIGDNSQSANGVFHGVIVAGGVSELVLTSNYIGDTVDSGTNKQGYGIYILNGNGSYIKASDNILKGNVTGTVYNGATGTNNSIITN